MKSKSDATRSDFNHPAWKGQKLKAELGSHEWRVFLVKALKTPPSKRSNAQRHAIELGQLMGLFPFSSRP